MDKIIRNIDHETWRQFTGYCKMKGILTGQELTRILKQYLQGKVK